MMNYEGVKRIREKISCPQLGDDHYGEWGILNLNQRIAIKELLDFVDAQENYIKSLRAKIEELGKVFKNCDEYELDECCENCVFYDNDRNDQPCCGCIDFENFVESEDEEEWQTN